MKFIIPILLLFMLLPAVNAQEVGRLSKAEIKKFQKEQKKADQEAEAELAAELTRYMVNNHKFVLEADYLSACSNLISEFSI